jgi:hypothetical protein
MKQMWQKGDWVIHNYKIKQVTGTEKGVVIEVSCGVLTCSSDNLEPYLRPLTLRNKVYAEGIEYYYLMLRNLPNSRNLNWPEINRYFCDLCLKAIDDPKVKYGENEMNQFLQEARDFVSKTREILDESQEVNGIQLWKK